MFSTLIGRVQTSEVKASGRGARKRKKIIADRHLGRLTPTSRLTSGLEQNAARLTNVAKSVRPGPGGAGPNGGPGEPGAASELRDHVNLVGLRARSLCVISNSTRCPSSKVR